jgi:hypothetical protein
LIKTKTKTEMLTKTKTWAETNTKTENFSITTDNACLLILKTNKALKVPNRLSDEILDNVFNQIIKSDLAISIS